MKVILIFVIYSLWTVMLFNKIVYSKQCKNKAGQIIFYPYDNKTGYIANQEQIAKCVKSFKKCFLLNVIGYKKDIADIFKNSEVITTPLSSSTFRKNLASNLSYLHLFSWCLIGIVMVIATYNYKPLFYLMLMMLFQPIQLIIQKFINK